MVQDTNTNGDRRESIWSIKQHWRAWYSLLFVLQMMVGMGFVCWQQCFVITDDTLLQTLIAISDGLPDIGVKAAISTVTLLEGLDIMMGFSKAVSDYLDKRNKQAHETGLQEGMDKGKSEGIRLMQNWLARKQQAEGRGEKFNEPPPKA